MRKKYMNICLILGLLCLVYGLIVAIAGSGGTKFFIVWIGIAVILFVLAVYMTRSERALARKSSW